MNTQSNNSFAELKARITDRIQELATATDLARVSEEMMRYLDTCARFHRYSMFNVIQILITCPDATAVAGFKKWQSMGRYVRKGEHGIPILAPIFSKVTDEDGVERDKLIGFKVVYVFDVSQTDGEPLPEPPDWKSPEMNSELQEHLLGFAQARGIHVETKAMQRDIQGISLGGKILLDPSAGTKTLIHEIAHELMHRGEDRPLSGCTRELEAESVAYVVGRHFGLEGLSSPNYNALNGATAEKIMEHLDRVRDTAANIINGVEKLAEPAC